MHDASGSNISRRRRLLFRLRRRAGAVAVAGAYRSHALNPRRFFSAASDAYDTSTTSFRSLRSRGAVTLDPSPTAGLAMSVVSRRPCHDQILRASVSVAVFAAWSCVSRTPAYTPERWSRTTTYGFFDVLRAAMIVSLVGREPAGPTPAGRSCFAWSTRIVNCHFGPSCPMNRFRPVHLSDTRLCKILIDILAEWALSLPVSKTQYRVRQTNAPVLTIPLGGCTSSGAPERVMNHIRFACAMVCGGLLLACDDIPETATTTTLTCSDLGDGVIACNNGGTYTVVEVVGGDGDGGAGGSSASVKPPAYCEAFPPYPDDLDCAVDDDCPLPMGPCEVAVCTAMGKCMSIAPSLGARHCGDSATCVAKSCCSL
jgi:hypothetical protein